MRSGGDWKRNYGRPYTGTKGETPDTDKGSPTDHRASPRPYREQRREHVEVSLLVSVLILLLTVCIAATHAASAADKDLGCLRAVAPYPNSTFDIGEVRG